MKLEFFGKATKEEINTFESYLGFSLPEDYRCFLRESNGGIAIDTHFCFFVSELNQLIPLSVLYGINLNKKPTNLQVWHDEYKDDLFKNSLIIGDDVGGGFIVLINDIQKKGVYYWDHAYYFEQSSDEINSYKIADSFSEFINGLKYVED